MVSVHTILNFGILEPWGGRGRGLEEEGEGWGTVKRQGFKVSGGGEGYRFKESL